MPLIKLDNGCLAYGHVPLLDATAFQLDAGERVAEEAQGHVRWLRPEFQNPRGATQAGLGVSRAPICDSHEARGTPPAPHPSTQAWPDTLPEQIATLATLGRARRLDDGRWMG